MENSTVQNLTVSKCESRIAVNVKNINVGETAQINITGPQDILGVVTVNIGGINYTAILSNGFGIINVDNLEKGDYVIIATYLENEKYLSCISDESYLFVFKNSSPLSVLFNESEIKVGCVSYIDVVVPVSATGNITVEVAGKSYVKPAVDGVAKFEVIFSSAGEVALFIRYSGDECYLENSTVQNLTVSKCESRIAVNVNNINVGEIAQINITGSEDISGEVTVNLDDINYTTVINNGFAMLNVSDLECGIYKISVKYLENAKYFSSLATQNISVSKIQSIILASDVICEYNGGNYLVATLKDEDGRPISGAEVSIDVNGVKDLTTDANGQIKLSTMNILPSIYNTVVNFKGNTRYLKSTTEVKLIVNKANPKLYASKKTFKSKVKTKKYTITLKTNNNAPLKGVKVILKIKNMKFTAKTNDAGKATFFIKKLTKKGTYTSTITFNGNSCYNALSKKVKITVK